MDIFLMTNLEMIDIFNIIYHIAYVTRTVWYGPRCIDYEVKPILGSKEEKNWCDVVERYNGS